MCGLEGSGQVIGKSEHMLVSLMEGCNFTWLDMLCLAVASGGGLLPALYSHFQPRVAVINSAGQTWAEYALVEAMVGPTLYQTSQGRKN